MSCPLATCPECRHYNSKPVDGYKHHQWCKAFPEGIPIDVIFAKEPNTTDCGNGVHYEPEE